MEGVKKLTTFGKQVKYRLIDIEQTQAWLQERIKEETGLFVDSGYMYKILTGQRNAPKITQAICEILEIQPVPES